MAQKQTFKSFLKEDISRSTMDRALFLVTTYLKRKTGYKFFTYPGIEHFRNSHEKGFGVRIYSTKNNISIRFNWHQPRPTSISLASIDIWLGKGLTTVRPFHISFESNTSLVKAIPLVAEAILNNTIAAKTVYTLPDNVPLNEGFAGDLGLIKEARGAALDVSNMFDDIVSMITAPSFSKGKVYSKYKSAGARIFEVIESSNSSLLQKKGTSYVWSGTARDIKRIKDSKDNLLLSIGCAKAEVSRSNGVEKIDATGNVNDLENSRERLTFEKQLEDLENLLKLTISGSANAIFIAGRGGVGKTHTTEKILASLGLEDGKGYFKNTGSTTAAGMYSLLFRYKDSVILFDDSDDAFKDQESRNLLKAATDTKKVRKLVWNKMGKNVVDPEGDISDEEMLDQGLIPRYFEFTGKIIFISNLKMDKLDPDGALRTRAYIIDIDPTTVEIYDFMLKIVDKVELEGGLTLDKASRIHVVELLRKGKSKGEPNLRKLSRGLNMAAGAKAAGVEVSDTDLTRMIETYA